MTTVTAPYTSKAIVQDSAVQITVDHLHYVRAEKSVTPFETVFINLFKGLKIVLNTPIVGRA